MCAEDLKTQKSHMEQVGETQVAAKKQREMLWRDAPHAWREGFSQGKVTKIAVEYTISGHT